MGETTHRAMRLALASLLAAALISQFVIGATDSGLTVVNFFSYFTVLSNAAAVVMLTLLAFRPERDRSTVFATFRGAVTVYMSVTGFVYATILYPQLVDVGVPEPWIDLSLHVIGPILVALDWILYPPPLRLSSRSPVLWLTFPAVYLGYSLIRGSMVDWYPYPFLDPNQSDIGYAAVGVWSIVVLVVIGGFNSLYYWWCNRRQPGLATG